MPCLPVLPCSTAPWPRPRTRPGQTPGLARQRRERHTFTRRNLIATLQLCAANPQSEPRQSLGDAIRQIYIDRYPDPADRKAIQAHFRAADLA